MITDLNKILVEWAYRTNDGQPNSKNSAHVIILERVLNDFGWSREARVELLNNLVEKTLVKNTNSLIPIFEIKITKIFTTIKSLYSVKNIIII